MESVDEYISRMKSNMHEYSSLLFDSDYDFLLSNERQRKKSINKALKNGKSNYSDSYLYKQLDFTNKVIKELQKRIKEGNVDMKENLNEDMNGNIFTEKDKEIFNQLKNQDEQETVYDLISNRIGEDITVGELNTILQSIFGKYDDIFLLHNDLYNADTDELQDLVVWDDDEMYTITFKVIDMEEGIIEITDVNVE